MAYELGRLIRRERLKKGLSLRRFAKEVDKSPAFIVTLEKDSSPPSAAEDTLRKIAEVLALDPDRLITMAGKTPGDVAPDDELEVALYRRIKRLTRERKNQLLHELDTEVAELDSGSFKAQSTRGKSE
jgi:transcriptional regulator with XRE-family HTH domain